MRLLSLVMIGGAFLLTVPTSGAQQINRNAPLALNLNKTEVQAPKDLQLQGVENSVILKPAAQTSQVLRAVKVKKRHQLSSIQRQPVIRLAEGELNLRPVLDSPGSLSRISMELSQRPNLARVTASRLEVMELEANEGVVVQQFASYRLLPGACTSAQNRAQLERSGVACFERKTRAQNIAALSDASSPRYIKDARERQRVLGMMDKHEAQVRKDVEQGIAEFRRMAAIPGQRAQLDAELGSQEVNRLLALPNADLEAELVNAAEVEVEEIMFVPGFDQTRVLRPVVDLLPPAVNLNRTAVIRTTSVKPAGVSLAQAQVRPKLINPDVAKRVLERAAQERTASHSIDEPIYLTGFTFGRSYEWKWRVSTTISWCWIGCKKTYYAEAFAGFDYGLGMRIPLKVRGQWNYSKTARKPATASLRLTYQTLNGSKHDYKQAGLSESQLFDGKELVAQVGVHAGFSYRVPVVGSGNFSVSPKFDATSYLPKPFTHGQFTPPMPGEPISLEKTLDYDVLNGRANYGFVGATVKPKIQFSLESTGAKFEVVDRISGQREVFRQHAGKEFRLAVNSNDVSHFAIENPVYDLRFEIMPGIVASLFADVSVWSKRWNHTVWFPELKLVLPPGGAKFSCHEGTACSKTYEATPDSLKRL